MRILDAAGRSESTRKKNPTQRSDEKEKRGKPRSSTKLEMVSRCVSEEGVWCLVMLSGNESVELGMCQTR